MKCNILWAVSSKRAVLTSEAPAPREGAPYSQAIVVGDLIFVSGQLPIDPTTDALVAGGISKQTARVLANLRAVLQAAGSDLDKLVKTTVFLSDRDHWAAMNETYRDLVGDVPPARTAVTVSRLSLDALVEIDAVAHR